MNTKEKNTYIHLLFKTRDTNEASLLKHLGAKYIKSKNINSDVWFFFEDKDACEENISAYLNGAFPEIESFINSQREIKKIIINSTRKNG